ncbi:hypothetical protein G6F22_020767 [Rhizopus arrhizus]|nr:hypothetical protein G6F22_020767 [Rhizopus arrhizus]
MDPFRQDHHRRPACRALCRAACAPCALPHRDAIAGGADGAGICRAGRVRAARAGSEPAERASVTRAAAGQAGALPSDLVRLPADRPGQPAGAGAIGRRASITHHAHHAHNARSA